MADKKISQLSAASTPLAGTEVLPIVQSGATVQVSVANLTAARTVAAATLSVNGGTVSAPSVTFSGDPNTGVYSPAADTIALSTGGSERARIDTTGRVLVGATTARANLFNSTSTASLQVEGTTADNSSLLVVRNSDTAAAAPFLIVGRARGTTVGSTTAVQAGDAIGSLSFQAFDGSEFVEAARIQATVNGTPGANDMPGALVFTTTSDGAASATERMRITSGGSIIAGGSVALATNATDGFLYVPTCAGAPIGTPTTVTGMAPIVVDTTNNKLYFYSSGAWRDAGP